MGIDKDKGQPAAAVELRRRAEELLRTKAAEKHPPRTEAELQRLLHELEVHRIELEMQNSELSRARNEAELALEKFSDLYDFSPVGYFTLDRDGVIREVNLTGADLLGVERSRLNGRRFGQFVAQEARPFFSAFLGKVFASRDKEAFQTSLLKDGNSALFVQMEAVAAESGGECRVAVIDITERRRAEEALQKEKEATKALRQAKELAEATARAKNQFLANMSHELRTPMTGVLGMLDFIFNTPLDVQQRDCVETARKSARRLLRILNDILDLAKVEAGKLSIETKPFILLDCVAGAIDLLMPEARRKGLELNCAMADDLPETVVGDQLRLLQIITNLCGNAVKFTEQGKVEVKVARGGATPEGKREFTFTVTDTGIGIPEDKRYLLFKDFSQLDESDTRIYGGTGLGLAISRELVERMGGKISCVSAEGAGSIFSFTLPLGEQSPAPPGSAAEPAMGVVPHPKGGRRARLLVAEDEETTRKVFGLMLKQMEFDIDFVADGRHAVEMWERGGV